MANNIPTAEEFIKEKLDYDDEFIADNIYNTSKVVIEFAKLHCEAQIEAILNNVKIITEEDWLPRTGTSFYTHTIDKDSIKNAYPLNEIK